MFVGYSLPDADFELRHMLKTAQLAGDNRNKRKITLILGGDKPAFSRYQRFFGDQLTEPDAGKFGGWLEAHAE